MSSKIRRSTCVCIGMILLCLLISAFNCEISSAATKKTHLKKIKLTINVTKSYQQKLIDKKGKTIKATKVKWASKNKSVAKISKKGKITAVKKGTAKMTAKYKGKTYKFTVKVTHYYTYGDYQHILYDLKLANKIMTYVKKCAEDWRNEDYDPLSYNYGDIVRGYGDAAYWMKEAEEITHNRETINCWSYNSGTGTWDEMITSLHTTYDSNSEYRSPVEMWRDERAAFVSDVLTNADLMEEACKEIEQIPAGLITFH